MRFRGFCLFGGHVCFVTVMAFGSVALLLGFCVCFAVDCCVQCFRLDCLLLLASAPPFVVCLFAPSPPLPPILGSGVGENPAADLTRQPPLPGAVLLGRRWLGRVLDANPLVISRTVALSDRASGGFGHRRFHQ
jgi:hypothetical protein